MKNTRNIIGLVGFSLIALAIVAHAPFAQAAEYKQSFSTSMSGAVEATPVSSSMTGTAEFDVSMDERAIDYTVTVSPRDNVSTIILECASNASEVGTPIVSLSTTGTIVESDIMAEAATCNPNIHTTSHLVQAMREGSVYVNVLTNQYPNGEIRGKLIDGQLPVDTDNGGTTGGSNTGDNTTTSGSTDGTSDNTGTSTTDNSGSNGSSSSNNSTGSTAAPMSSGGYISGGYVIYPTTVSYSTTTTSTSSTGTSTPVYLSSYIKAGAENDAFQVTLLQIFLNKHMNAGLTLTGIYNAETMQSVNAFQLKYADEVLKPWVAYGLPTATTTTGYVYKTTLWKINSIEAGYTLSFPILP